MHAACAARPLEPPPGRRVRWRARRRPVPRRAAAAAAGAGRLVPGLRRIEGMEGSSRFGALRTLAGGGRWPPGRQMAAQPSGPQTTSAKRAANHPRPTQSAGLLCQIMRGRTFSFLPRNSASRDTPDTLTTLKRTPGISPTAWPRRPKPAMSTSSCAGKWGTSVVSVGAWPLAAALATIDERSGTAETWRRLRTSHLLVPAACRNPLAAMPACALCDRACRKKPIECLPSSWHPCCKPVSPAGRPAVRHTPRQQAARPLAAALAGRLCCCKLHAVSSSPLRAACRPTARATAPARQGAAACTTWQRWHVMAHKHWRAKPHSPTPIPQSPPHVLLNEVEAAVVGHERRNLLACGER